MIEMYVERARNQEDGSNKMSSSAKVVVFLSCISSGLGHVQLDQSKVLLSGKICYQADIGGIRALFLTGITLPCSTLQEIFDLLRNSCMRAFDTHEKNFSSITAARRIDITENRSL